MSNVSPFGFLFGKGLNDLIRGIRRCQSEEQHAAFLMEAVAECRDEVKSNDMDVKSTAVLKLAYLEMLGLDMRWSGFHVIEVMASSHFQQKRIGYLAAMQSLAGDSEMLMLMTNLLKMDLVSRDASIVGMALSGLATVVSPLLAADTADDIMRMLNHSKPYIRQKAVLALHNVVLEYPEFLSPALERIADLLDRAQQDPEDSGNISVVSATVSVICELSKHSSNISDYLDLTPRLYSIFNTSQHNWTLIKLLKTFALFSKKEPRLKSKLLPSIRDMMLQSSATSLIYESIRCIVHGGMLGANDHELALQCVNQIKSQSEQKDANLTLLSAELLGSIAEINSEFLSQDSVVELLGIVHTDPITHRRILNLVKHCINDDSMFDLASLLMSHFRNKDLPEGHKYDLAITIADMVAKDNYEYVPNFDWLLSLFEELCQELVPSALSLRILDIVIRVKDQEVRNSLGQMCWRWLNDQIQQNGLPAEETSLKTKSSVQDKLKFADICWWIIGEFPSSAILADPTSFVKELGYPNQRISHASPALATCVAKLVAKAEDPSSELLDAAIELFTPLSFSMDFELHERTCQYLEILKLAKLSPEQSDSLVHQGLASLFTSYELAPIAPGSQLKVGIPDWLDLETPVTLSNLEDPLLPFETDNSDSDADLESSIELAPYSDNYKQNVYNGPHVEESINEASEATSKSTNDAHLFNLTALETRQRERPAKKKVQISSDDIVENDKGPTPPVDSLSLENSDSNASAKKIFKSGFRTPSVLIGLDEDQQPPPLKVKNKKNSRSKNSSI